VLGEEVAALLQRSRNRGRNQNQSTTPRRPKEMGAERMSGLRAADGCRLTGEFGGFSYCIAEARWAGLCTSEGRCWTAWYRALYDKALRARRFVSARQWRDVIVLELAVGGGVFWSGLFSAPREMGGDRGYQRLP